MANYVAAERSNPFTVRDPDALKRELEPLGIIVEVSEEVPNQVTLFCEADNGGWPSTHYDEETGEDTDISIHEIVAAYLVEGHVAVLVEAGHEKRRYVGGVAVAVNSAGETCEVDLVEIYERAARLGSELLPA